MLNKPLKERMTVEQFKDIIYKYDAIVDSINNNEGRDTSIKAFEFAYDMLERRTDMCFKLIETLASFIFTEDELDCIVEYMNTPQKLEDCAFISYVDLYENLNDSFGKKY